MVYIHSWQEYQEAAENLYANSPRKVRAPFLEPPYPATSVRCLASSRLRCLRARNRTKNDLLFSFYFSADGLIYLLLLVGFEDSVQRKMEIFGG